MKRFKTLVMSVLALSALTELGMVAPAQAATVTDTFELKATVKQFCEGNPKFFQNFKVKVAHLITITVTRDVNNDNNLTDIQATINNTENADLDAITMNGLIFPRNTSGSKAELVFSGVNPGNADHFVTVRGQATFDKLGSLTKMTGTYVSQIPDSYSLPGGGDSPPVECFASGTFVTGKKLP